MLYKDGRKQSMGSRPAGPCARAFTLVELLVVIGIIAVLVAILLPVLGKARVQANAVKCMANLRQIGNAVQIYRNLNRGFGPNYRNEGRWIDVAAPAQMIDPGDVNAYWGVQYAVIGKFPRMIFNCPVANETLYAASVRFDGAFRDGHIYNCYSLNAYGNNYIGTPADDDVRRKAEHGSVDEIAMFRRAKIGSSTIWLGRNLVRNKATSMLILAHDGFEATIDGDGDTLNEFTQYAADYIDRRNEYLRHNKKANVLFADCHVAPMSMKELQDTRYYTGRWELPPAPVTTP